MKWLFPSGAAALGILNIIETAAAIHWTYILRKTPGKAQNIKHGKRLVKLRAVKEKSGFGKENCHCSKITSPPMGVSLFAGGS